MADHWVTEPSDEFTIGQTVCARIVHVDEKKTQLSLNIKPSIIGVGGALYLRSLIAERIVTASTGMEESMRLALCELSMGSLARGIVKQIRDFGLILELEGGVAAFCMTEHTPKGRRAPSVGASVECCVLDVDWSKKVADVSLRSSLVEAARLGPQAASLTSEEAVAGSVELVKDDYAVVSVPSLGNALALAAITGYQKPLVLMRCELGLRARLWDAVTTRRTLGCAPRSYVRSG